MQLQQRHMAGSRSRSVVGASLAADTEAKAEAVVGRRRAEGCRQRSCLRLRAGAGAGDGAVAG